MSFYLMKFISQLCYPLPLFFIVLALATAVLCYSKIFSLLLTLLAIIWLSLWSTPFLPQFLLQRLEAQTPPLVQLPKNIETIVVLGGGAHTSSTPSAFTELSQASLARLICAIQLYQQAQHPVTLIVSGGAVLGRPIEAELLKQAAIKLGVPKEHIVMDINSKNTQAQAIEIKKRLKNKKFILVTSAFHMPRALWLFQQQGLNPIPAPCDFQATTRPQFRYLPQAYYLQHARIVIHEYLGRLWASLH